MVSDNYSPATVRKAFNTLSQLMRAAVSDRRIWFDPCQDVPLPRRGITSNDSLALPRLSV